ncbi:MAG: agmatinase family protein [Rikenellaceae bacterium]
MDKNFDPNDLSIANGNYFALPYDAQQCDLVLISVPWDVTVSYNDGTAQGPDAIIEASEQVDLYDFDNPDGYKKGIGTVPIEEWLMFESSMLRRDAKRVIEMLSNGVTSCNESIKKRVEKIDEGCRKMNNYVYESSKEWLEKGKKVALVGGDHSTPLGLIRAVAERYGEIAVLHIDAHADLRQAYEGFEFSHASIMYNVISSVEQVKSLVQVGIRDVCDNEIELIHDNNKITTFFDTQLQEREFMGGNWDSVCENIVASLGCDKVYVSFDIDGLSPDNCPSTGTPVPGGLSFAKAVHLIKKITNSDKEIVGFDLVEVAPHPSGEDEWDANVGARMLYKLCNLALK